MRWAESFIIISEGECCYSCGTMWRGATRIRLGNEPAAIDTVAHRPISRTIDGADKQEDLFLAVVLGGWRVESKSPAHFVRKLTREGKFSLLRGKCSQNSGGNFMRRRVDSQEEGETRLSLICVRVTLVTCPSFIYSLQEKLPEQVQLWSFVLCCLVLQLRKCADTRPVLSPVH